MNKIDAFPDDWVSILSCSMHGDNHAHRVKVTHHLEIGMDIEDSEWGGCESIVGSDIIVPHLIFGDHMNNLILQLHEGDHWYRFTDGRIHAECSSCDGTTESSCTIYEYHTLYSLIVYGLSDQERWTLNIYISDMDDMKIQYPTENDILTHLQ